MTFDPDPAIRHRLQKSRRRSRLLQSKQSHNLPEDTKMSKRPEGAVSRPTIETAPILPRPERVESGWAEAWSKEFGHLAPAEQARREELRKQAGAHLGIQPEDVTVLPAEPEKPTLLAQLSALAAPPKGPSAESVELLAQVRKERGEQRAELQARLRKDLAPTFERSAATCATVTALAKDYAPVLKKLRAVPEEQYLRQLPKNSASETLVTRLIEALDSLLSLFASGPASLIEAGKRLDAFVAGIAGPTLAPQEKSNILAERAALENLCELPGQIDAQLRQVLSMRQVIDQRIEDEANTALDAATNPDATEITAEQRLALARAAGRGR